MCVCVCWGSYCGDKRGNDPAVSGRPSSFLYSPSGHHGQDSSSSSSFLFFIYLFFLSSRGLRPPEALVKEGNYRLQTFNNEPLSSLPCPPPSSPLTPTLPPLPPPHSPLCLSGFLGGHCILMSISNFSCLLSCLTPLIHQYIIRDKVLWTPAAVTR